MMKSVLFTLLSLPFLAAAAPRLYLDSGHRSNSGFLAPESRIRLVFDKEVTGKEHLGKKLPNTLVQTTPDLGGCLLWKSGNIAHFIPGKFPPLDTKVLLRIRKGQTYLDGTPIKALKLKTLKTEPFHILRDHHRGTKRSGHCIVTLNDPPNTKTAAAFFHFTDKNGQIVPARTRLATWADLQSSYYLRPTWRQRISKEKFPPKKDLPPGRVFANILLIDPVFPLPLGKNWKLNVLAGLPNSTGKAKLSKGTQLHIGHIVPLAISGAKAVTLQDAPRHISVDFNQTLSGNLSPQNLRPLVTVSPKVPYTVAISPSRRGIIINADFSKHDTWSLHLNKALPSAEGTTLAKEWKKKLRFERLTPGISLPGHQEAQLASGKRTYEIATLNMKQIRLRVKLMEKESLVRACQGYRHYTGIGPNGSELQHTVPLPFELISGKTLIDQVIPLPKPLDTSHPHTIHWDKLLPQNLRHASCFVSVTGTPQDGPGFKKARPKIVQSLVHLTDLGLAWKLSRDSAFLYAYSCETGRPVPGATLEVFGEDAKPLAKAKTNAEGIARLPRLPAHRHLLATLGGDSVILPFDNTLPTARMWRFPVDYGWDSPPEQTRKVLLFTDRTLYRPGETVRLKGIVRVLKNNRILLPGKAGLQANALPPLPEKPILVLKDSNYRELFRQRIALSPAGSFDIEHPLPESTVGRFSFTLSWPNELAKAEAIDDWREADPIRENASHSHGFHVQEFKRNAFSAEATLAQATEKQAPDASSETAPQKTPAATGTITMDYRLSAKYYQGVPLSKAKVSWYLDANPDGFYPDRFRDYLFGDHREYDPYYWNHYFGYSEDEHYSRSGSHDENGEASLDPDGKLALPLALPPLDFPSPRDITVTSEITDARNQTLSDTTSATVHSSSFYLGLARMDSIARAGEEIPLKLLAVSKEGKPLPRDTKVTLSVIRETNRQTKSRAPNGKIVISNEKESHEVHRQTLALPAKANTTGGLLIPYTPEQAGKHTFVLESADPDGQPVKTSVVRHIYGTGQYPWAYEPGLRIKLVPEQKQYLPGDTARILVLTPIEGTALVTLERDGVLRHHIAELRLDDPVIKIPLDETDAPNTYVSVLVIKGARNNKRKAKQALARLGYCELKVESLASRLKVDLAASRPCVRPGEPLTASGTVKTSNGQPAANAEVTFYAEDEGTLAVSGYSNPDPIALFLAPRLLRTRAGTSLSHFIADDPSDRHHANKGFFIGGGDFAPCEAPSPPPPGNLRHNFDPCAAWFPSLKTDASGRFQATFNVPDTLTRYRLIAVAHHGDGHFGTGTAEATVKKPLMLEPHPPRFANEGDHIQPTALVQNTTSHSGSWKITLRPGSLAAPGSPEAPSSPPSAKPHELTRLVTLPPHSQKTVPFDLHFTGTGTARWLWKAEPVSLAKDLLTPSLRKELSDQVESTFEVRYPMPLLRETHFVTFEDPARKQDLLRDFSPELLDGRGHIELEFARSRLLEAAGAIEHLLHYPYGCAEQTTSSTIPWIAARQMRHLVPKFKDK